MELIVSTTSVKAPGGIDPSTKPASAKASVSGTPAPQSDPTPREAPTPEQIKHAIEAANEALMALSSDLEFSQDPSTGKTVIRIIDTSSQQILRQFPSEEMLAIARAVDRFQGLLLKEKA